MIRRCRPSPWFVLGILALSPVPASLGQEQAATHPSVRDPARNDSFDAKLTLLREARARGDFDLARSLTHSLRDTLLQEQVESPSTDPKVIAGPVLPTERLPSPWQDYLRGWKRCRILEVREPIGRDRTNEPVQLTLSFPRERVQDLDRELRVVRIDGSGLVEVPSQVLRVGHSGAEDIGEVVWQCDVAAHSSTKFLILFDNPYAERPEYPTDLDVRGEGVGLQILNQFFSASLSKQSGQLERLVLRREHGLELFSGGDGHGEPPGIDWAHDYVDKGNFQKLRVTLWDQPPEYEIRKGPVCTVVRRWGFPRSPIHPVYSPAKLHITVEYRFYSNLPWFHKLGTMEAIQDLDVSALRDDEWVFSGQSFTDSFWFDQAGKFQLGAVPPAQSEAIWGVGFFHRESRDSFAGMFLEHSAGGIPELKHTGAPIMFYKWHGHVWSRYPLPTHELPAGTVIRQKNAYLSIPFSFPEDVATLEAMYATLKHPVEATGLDLPDLGPESGCQPPPTGSRLARPGEYGELTRLKDAVWEALRDCKDAQLYTADIDVVDLGLVQDVRIRGETVTLQMGMPHRGRPVLSYFTHGSISVHPTRSVPIRERLLQIPGIKNVQIVPSWDPLWSSRRLSPAGRAKLGLDD